MYILIKYICERCINLYKDELINDGWQEGNIKDTKEGICSICGKIEGKKTIQGQITTAAINEYFKQKEMEKDKEK